MIPILRWLGRRTWCFFTGHRFVPERVYWPSSMSMEDGYRCQRCDKKCVFLWPWDEVAEGD